MSVASSQVYARQLLPQKYGYPLYIPEPSDNLPLQFRERGVSIGDVGVVMPNGSFNFAFSVCAPADDPVNCFGVPAGFQPMRLEPQRISQWQNMHRKGSEVMSSSIKKENISASGGLKENELLNVSAGVSVEYSLTSSYSEAAVLNMPDGAAGMDYNSLAELRNHALQNAVSWYEFINGTLGLEASNGSLYFVTGCDKSTTWGIATISQGSSSNSLALRFTAAQLIEASASYTCSWETHCPGSVRTGPDFGDEVGLPQNQCLFIRGFKIMVREGAMAIWKGPVEVTRTLDLKPGNLFPGGKTSSFPGAWGARRSLSKGSGDTGKSSGQQRIAYSPDCEDEYWSSDDDELNLDAGVYHPLDIINSYLLDKTQAQVAVTHESDWWTLCPRSVLPSDEEILERLCSHYQPSLEHEGVFLVPREKSPYAPSKPRRPVSERGPVYSTLAEGKVPAGSGRKNSRYIEPLNQTWMAQRDENVPDEPIFAFNVPPDSHHDSVSTTGPGYNSFNAISSLYPTPEGIPQSDQNIPEESVFAFNVLPDPRQDLASTIRPGGHRSSKPISSRRPITADSVVRWTGESWKWVPKGCRKLVVRRYK